MNLYARQREVVKHGKASVYSHVQLSDDMKGLFSIFQQKKKKLVHKAKDPC